MKHLFFMLFVVLAVNSKAQTVGKWSVGVGFTPSIQSGSTYAVHINRHLGANWQIGVTPFSWFNSSNGGPASNWNSNSFGLNLTSRYVFVDGKSLRPYLQGFTGYGHTTTTYESSFFGETKDELDYLNFSVGIGTEIAIGKKGWFADINFGYFRYQSLSGVNNFNSPLGSIGVLKRFGK